jgi:glyoxylase-like metal-dependent hydrolase (beta-lactamase superfamily II)
VESAAADAKRSEGDSILATLGVRRLPLPIPFQQAGGPINAYLIDNADGSLTLWDTGLSTDECRAALEQGFKDAGRRVEEVSRILVSHGHVDHFGLAREVSERSGAKVLVHRADWNKVLLGRNRAPAGDELKTLGVPDELVAQIARMHSKTSSFAQLLDSVEPLEPGTRFSFARFEGEILHFPGHTPGLVCLHDAAHRVLFTDDHLLPRVSPNPLLEPPDKDGKSPHRALAAYLASAKKLYAMELDWLLPGHGEPFQNHRALLDSLFRFYDRRQEKLARALAGGPKTAYGLIADLFSEAGVMQMFLMLSEVVGNLEVLEDQGRVVREPGSSPWRFRLVA